MMNNQLKYIDYIKEFAYKNNVHIWLGGSFLRGNATPFSDVDVSVYCNADLLDKFIYGYGKPVYISYTTNPRGILIVIYEDGVAVDLEVIKSIDISGDEFFYAEDIKELKYVRDEIICEKFALRNDTPYQMARLLHRSMIKFLAGKKDAGLSVADEIASYMGIEKTFDEENYKSQITQVL
ncbi:MAG: nucleotidyltransferase domain-containing protein, partial [Lachnospiraceae bacterium]|nr:nucleotidyltransferase domain-containing protein [Lachnospiraceae bacterium]